jgi:hypothetical protein
VVIDDNVIAATGHAAAAFEQIAEFNRTTMHTRDAHPSDISDQIAHLAALVAALPQAFSQLSSSADAAVRDQALRMDGTSPDEDPAIAIGVARLELADAKDVAVELYKLLDAAHNATAHIISAGVADRRVPS